MGLGHSETQFSVSRTDPGGGPYYDCKGSDLGEATRSEQRDLKQGLEPKDTDPARSERGHWSRTERCRRTLGLGTREST